MKPNETKKFRDWLVSRGAQVLVATNPYEVLRFRTGNGVSVVYRGDSGKETYTGESAEAFQAFKTQAAWRGAKKVNRRPVSSVVARTIRKRDGDLCFFCARLVSVEDESVEHLVPKTCGGPNHISNLFLAHSECNRFAGHMSAPEKIQIHVNARINP